MSIFPDNHFDAIGGLGVQFQSFRQQEIFLSEAYRTLRDGGTLEFTSQHYFGDMVEYIQNAGFKNASIVGRDYPRRLRFRATK